LNHFTVPCAILTFFVPDAAPATTAGVRAFRNCFWDSLSSNAWHKLAGPPKPYRQPEQPHPAQ
jgi:hypothetical protein